MFTKNKNKSKLEKVIEEIAKEWQKVKTETKQFMLLAERKKMNT